MTRLKILLFTAVVVWGCGGLRPANAGNVVEGFDLRRTPNVPAQQAPMEQAAAEVRLKALVPGTQVVLDEVTGSPKWIMSFEGQLSGPKGEGRGVTRKAARAHDDQDPDRPVKAFLDEHRDLYRHGSAILQTAIKKRDFVSEHSGIRTKTWEQFLDGIPVYGGLLTAHETKKGELVGISSGFLPDPASAADAARPNLKVRRDKPGLSARQAVARAIENIGENVSEARIRPERSETSLLAKAEIFAAEGLPGEVRASLVWLPFSGSQARLCWAVVVARPYRNETFQVLIDAHTGEAVLRRNMTFDLREATYRVFTGESPTPMSPGWPTPSTNQPPAVERSLVTLAALNTNASPAGWIADADNETRGNNVDAHLDRNADNRPDLPRPQGQPFRVFDFPMNLEESPDSYREAAVVQLFYWCNWMHDQLYQLGFTEAAGNFQKDNFGRGGLGGDPLMADAQDGSGYNNANYTSAPDGQSPRIQMYLFNGPDPWRDGDFDASVILHEYTHGLSDRLLGGGAGISQWQTYGMAEGWSDFYALALLNNPADPAGSTYPVGPYLSHLFGGLKESYYFGIRRYPVTTDMSKNPLTLKDIDPTQASLHAGIPCSPTSSGSASEVHKVGEVWCAALWEARARMIAKFGPTNGNQTILRLVTDGMKLSPPNPTFVQARNAILLADVVMNNAANRIDLWTAFAKRGLGYSASTPDSGTTFGVIEAFDYPDNLVVSDTNRFVATGKAGGPFTPPTQTYTLLNAGGGYVTWSLKSAPLWVTVSPASGLIGPAGSNVVTLTINTLANNLLAGLYSSSVELMNQGTGQKLELPLLLQVNDDLGGTPDSLVEIFNGNGDFDLDYTTLIFTSGGEPDAASYTVCATPAAGLPTNPLGGEPIPAVDDSYALLSLGEGREVSLFGAKTNQVLVGSNGDIVFNVPTNLGYLFDPLKQVYTNFFYPQESAFFGQERVAPLYVDLNPAAGGTVSWRQLSNRVAVTWKDVPEYGVANSNTFQVEWFFDGTIRFTYANVAPRIGVNYTSPKVGLVRPGGLPPTVVETDFSMGHSCLPKMSLLVPEDVNEGQGVYQGAVQLAAPSPIPVMVEFTLSDTNASIDPPILVILEGDLTGFFSFSVRDDHRLRGTWPLTMTVSASGYAEASQVIGVIDMETAALTVNVPARVNEGQGLVSGEVWMDAVPEMPIAVQLSSTSPNLVQVPATVTIAAGTNRAPFDMWVGEDAFITGPVAVAVVAHVANWEDDADAMVVLDNESTNLFLTAPSQVSERAGVIVRGGRVAIGGYLSTNLILTLTSTNSNLISVTNQVTIPAGQNAVSFDLTVIDDSVPNGTRSTALGAAALGFATATANIRVLDDEIPSYPTNPSPSHLAVRVSTDVTLAWNIQQTGGTTDMVFDVYLGTNAVPGTAELLGTTTNNNWSVRGLSIGTVYCWQVVVRAQSQLLAGPVWQFTTVGLNGFTFGPLGSPQVAGQPIPITVTAVDEAGGTATSFGGPLALRAYGSKPSGATVVITEVSPAGFDKVEFANVSGRELNLANWQVVLYDWTTWPEPRLVFTIPEGSISGPGDLFRVRKVSTRPMPSPGMYPLFNLPVQPSWTINPDGNPIAVMLLNADGQIVDFMCAVDADPSQIASPLGVTASQWTGGAVPPGLPTGYTYQRIGFADHDSALDWVVATNNMGKTNQQLSVPFHDTTELAVQPGELNGFTNGIWTGQISLPSTMGQDIRLMVDDGRGHEGSSAPFALSPAGNLSVAMAVQPVGRKTVGNLIIYQLVVSNTGPGSAQGVVLLDTLPDGAEFLSATVSQGVFAYKSNSLIAELGTVAAAGVARAELTIRPGVAMVLTNRAEVSRLEPEIYTEDNRAEIVSTVSYTFVSISDSGVKEGNSGSKDMLFNLQLSEPSPDTVTVDYATSDGTATAGVDYLATAGTVTFPAGVTNATLAVNVIGDAVTESNETLFVTLSFPSNALMGLGSAMGIITNDDSNPLLTISDVSVVEGDSGFTNALFEVTLSAPSGLPISVSWETTNITAAAGIDYVPAGGRVVFFPGETNQTISVGVLGNTMYQPDHTFAVQLSYPFNSGFSKNRGVGTILDDDAWRLHDFSWSLVAPTQYQHEPFAVTLTARDALGRPITNFDGSVSIRGSCSNAVSVVGTGSGTWATPFGAFYHDARVQVIYPAMELSSTGRITAVALDVALVPGQTLSNFTIRLRHTPLASYPSSPVWETNWTQVYQGNLTLTATGWITLALQMPFDYNGMDNLMADFSFNNDTYSSDGLCRVTSTAGSRSLSFRTDSGFGDPLLWSGGANPPPSSSTQVPNARFHFEIPASMAPEVAVNFVNGVWAGLVNFEGTGGSMVLHALDGEGHGGSSHPFDVIIRDSDADGMSDEWEVANKLDPLDSSDAGLDPDGDGMTNLAEFWAGTNPHDASSVLRIDSIMPAGSSYLAFGFDSASNRQYQLIATTNVGSGAWAPTSPVWKGTGGHMVVTNRVYRTYPNWFFRLKVTP